MFQYNCFPLWISVFCSSSSCSPPHIQDPPFLSPIRSQRGAGWRFAIKREQRSSWRLDTEEVRALRGSQGVIVTRGLGRGSNWGEGRGWDTCPYRLPAGGGLSRAVGGWYAKPEPTPPGFSPHSGFCNTSDSIAGTRRRKQMEFWVCLCPHPNPQPLESYNMAARVVESATLGFNWTMRFLGTDSPAHFLPR